MEKKKLTKEQQKERKEKFNKWCKRLLIISLAVNVFFVICTIVGSCNSKKDVNTSTNNTQIAKVLRQKNNAVGDEFDNNSVHSYDFLKFKKDYSFSITRTINLDYTFSTQNLVICNYQYPVASANHIRARGTLHSPVQNGDYIEVSAHTDTDGTLSGNILYIKYQWSYQYEWTTIYRPIGGSAYFDSEQGFSLVYNEPLTSSSSFNLDWLDFFDELESVEYNLSNYWSPYSFFTPVGGNNQLIVNANIGQNYTNLTEDVVFTCGGKIYTNIQYMLAPFTNDDWQYYDGSQVAKTTYNYKYIAYVYYYNLFTNERILAMSRDYYSWVREDEATSLILDVTKPLYFVNSKVANIKLYNVHLKGDSYRDGYTNSDIFTTAYVGSMNITGGGNFGNVFTLFTSAFDGLKGLFSISILPGITIGVLMFLPLVGIIVFAIIRIIKK